MSKERRGKGGKEAREEKVFEIYRVKRERKDGLKYYRHVSRLE